MKECLTRSISKYIELSPEEENLIGTFWTEKTLEKGDYLLRNGETCKTDNFVIGGALKAFYINSKTGKEEILYFAIEDWWATDIESFQKQKPSIYNIQAIENPQLPETEDFDFYTPNIQQNVHRRNGEVTGSRSFGYYAIPNEPGRYDLADFFEWTFFNPRTEQYETLKSELVVDVSGESKKNEAILATDLGSFYEIIDLQDNKLRQRHQFEYLKIFANIFILVMLVLTAVFIFRK